MPLFNIKMCGWLVKHIITYLQQPTEKSLRCKHPSKAYTGVCGFSSTDLVKLGKHPFNPTSEIKSSQDEFLQNLKQETNRNERI